MDESKNKKPNHSPIIPLINSGDPLEPVARAQAKKIIVTIVNQQHDIQQQAGFFKKIFHTSTPHITDTKTTTINLYNPGPELIMWEMYKIKHIPTVLRWVKELFNNHHFKARLEHNSDYIITTYATKNKWNDAIKDWSSHNSATYSALVTCDRKLILRKETNNSVYLWTKVKDVYARYDKDSEQLKPERFDKQTLIKLEASSLQETIKNLIRLFPNFKVHTLVHNLEHPSKIGETASLDNNKSMDAYVAGNPLRIQMSDLLKDKPTTSQTTEKKDAQIEEVGKELINLISTGIKNKKK